MRGPERLSVRTEAAFQMIDLSDRAVSVVDGAGLAEGALSAFCPHTSCGLAITEVEEGLHADVESVLEQLAPMSRAWAHDDLARRWQNLEPDERRNGWSHIRSLLATQPSLVVPILDGQLALGRWQRLLLVELDGPRPARTVVLQAWGRPGPPPPSAAPGRSVEELGQG